MENSTAQTNSTSYYYTEDGLLTGFGSTWVLDTWSFLPFTITSAIGFILNILAFLVFQDSEFNIPLYAYLRVYCLNNACLNFLTLFNFTFSSIRLFSFANSYWAQVYFNYIYSPISNMNYFYSSVLDITILLDRLVHFENRIKGLFKLKPYWICVIAFFICFIVDSPYYFLYAPASLTVYLNATTTFTFWYGWPTSFGASHLATVLAYLVAGLRDVLVVILQIALNLASMIYLKRYLNRKRKICNRTCVQTTNNMAASTHTHTQTAISSSILKAQRDRISQSELRATIMVNFFFISFFIFKSTCYK
jgi:hypothetical protein